MIAASFVGSEEEIIMLLLGIPEILSETILGSFSIEFEAD